MAWVTPAQADLSSGIAQFHMRARWTGSEFTVSKYIGETEMNLETILKEVQASLDAYRKAKVEALDKQSYMEAVKQQSTANRFQSEIALTDARQRLQDHREQMEVKKKARIKAKVERITAGAPVKPVVFEFDTKERQLTIEVEEAEAVFAKILEVYTNDCDELAKAEAKVVSATQAISTAYMEGVATKALFYDSLMRELHAELSKMVPLEIDLRPGEFQRRPDAVKKALGLVVTDPFHTPANKLPGFHAPRVVFAHRTPAVNTVAQDELPTYVGGNNPPRNVDGIPTKI